MITINNKSFEEKICIRNKRKLNVKNQALDGSLYGSHQGYNYSYEISIEQINESDLNFLENLNTRFVFVDSSNRKINARIFEDVSIDNKFYFNNEYYYNVSLLIEEVVK